MVRNHNHPIDLILDDIESLRKIVISAKADTPQFRTLLRNMLKHVEDVRDLEQVPLRTYNVLSALLSPLLDTENKLLLDHLKTRHDTDAVRSLKKYLDKRNHQSDHVDQSIQAMRTSIERMYVLLNHPPAPDSSDEQLCKTTEDSLRSHLDGDALLRTEVENLVEVTQLSLQTINSIIRDTGDDASDMAEIEKILEQKLPDNPEEAYTLLQQTRKALLKSLRRLSESSSSLQQAMRTQVKSIESLSQRLEHAEDQANTDALTGLANRRQLGRFMSKLEEGTASLLMLDLDRFKSINDRYGHLIGDKILAEFGGLLVSNIRTTDIAARFGGEEFCIVLPNTTHEQAITRAISLKESIAAQTFVTDAGQVQITASIGLAVRHKEETIPHWSKRADTALYKAKQSGRDRVVSAESETNG